MTPELKGFLLLSIIKMLVVFTLIMIGVALLTFGQPTLAEFFATQ